MAWVGQQSSAGTADFHVCHRTLSRHVLSGKAKVRDNAKTYARDCSTYKVTENPGTDGTFPSFWRVAHV